MKHQHLIIATLSVLFMVGCGTQALEERDALNLQSINAKQEALSKTDKRDNENINIQSINTTQEKLGRLSQKDEKDQPALSLEGFNHTQGDN